MPRHNAGTPKKNKVSAVSGDKEAEEMAGNMARFVESGYAGAISCPVLIHRGIILAKSFVGSGVCNDGMTE